MHGGGYVMGDASLDDRNCSRFANDLDITGASVDYRLAPEHPYPAALEDCHNALRWLADQPGVDPARTAVGGMSAGGGLAAALAQRLRNDTAAPEVIFQLLVYPMLDDRASAKAHKHSRQFRMLNQACNRFAWNCYIGDTEPEAVAPARCADLSGLPPTWIGAGSLDVFHDEDVLYAERLRASGVPCELHVADGAFHAFDAIVPKSTVAQSFTKAPMSSLRNAFSDGSL